MTTPEAIEFKTILQHGTVTIPPEYYAQWEGQRIRVLLLDDSDPLALRIEQPPTGARLEVALREGTVPSFEAISLDTRGFKFNREEANAR